MAQKRFSPEQIIGMLRDVEVRLSQGEKINGISRSFGITEQTYFGKKKVTLCMKITTSFNNCVKTI